MDLWIVFFAALATAFATGLGALPLLFMRDPSPRTLGVSTAIAGGLMLAATQLLVLEGVDISAQKTGVGVLMGMVSIFVIAKLVHLRPDSDIGALRSANARSAFLIIAVMTAHSAAEGIGVGVSFAGGQELGWLVAVAIAIHNIPEGLAISLTLVPHGVSIRAAAGWSIFSSLPQPLLAVPAFLFVEQFEGVLPIGLGIAAGAMLWMVVAELIPEALGRATWPNVLGGVAAGYLVMFAFTSLLT